MRNGVPTIDEVRAYCLERKNGIDPEEFFYFYESKGWVIGRVPMKSWRAAIITWERRQKKTNGRHLKGKSETKAEMQALFAQSVSAPTEDQMRRLRGIAPG